MPDLPVIALTFANDQTQPGRYLRHLPEEARQLHSTLDRLAQAGRCELVERPFATLAQLLDLFQDARYRDRITLLHYGGHADSYHLLLEAANQQSHTVGAAGLAAFLGQQQGLRLVFLNGCATEGHVKELLAAGVPIVIATDRAIEDTVAMEFASRFYQGLAGGVSVRRAFNEAAAAIRAGQGVDKLRGLYWNPAEAADIWPWSLHESYSGAADWTVPEPPPTQADEQSGPRIENADVAGLVDLRGANLSGSQNLTITGVVLKKPGPEKE
jgi:hypothetical protein